MAHADDMNILNLSNIKEHPIKVTIGILVVIFVAGYNAKPWAVEEFSKEFVTKADAAKNVATIEKRLTVMQLTMNSNSRAVDTLSTEVRVSSAFQMERGIKDDLDQHNHDKPVPVTAKWLDTQKHLEDRYRLSVDYKSCVVNEGINCNLLQKQLWQ